MVKKVLVLSLMVIVLMMSYLRQQIVAVEEEDLNLYAHAAILMDGSNGRVLWELNGKEKRAMASTTKIMTTLIALEYGNLEDEVVVSKKASLAPEVKLHIREGEKYKLGDLLYALMLESSNDVAVAIAEHIGGSVEGFADMMNEKAYDIGAFDTHYVTPNGLDADGHQSTAYDLALIAKYALNNEDFVQLINTKQKNFFELTTGREHVVYNKNTFLDMMDGAIGVKTGFTSQAGYCFVGAVKEEGKYFISVVLASGWPPNRSWKWRDTMKIMNYAFEHFHYQQVIEEPKRYDPIYVEDGKIPYVSVATDKTLGLLLGENEQVKSRVTLPKQLVAPIQEGVTIGYLDIYVDGDLFKKIPIKTTESVEKIDFRFCLDRILEEFF